MRKAAFVVSVGLLALVPLGVLAQKDPDEPADPDPKPAQPSRPFLTPGRRPAPKPAQPSPAPAQPAPQPAQPQPAQPQPAKPAQPAPAQPQPAQPQPSQPQPAQPQPAKPVQPTQPQPAQPQAQPAQPRTTTSPSTATPAQPGQQQGTAAQPAPGAPPAGGGTRTITATSVDSQQPAQPAQPGQAAQPGQPGQAAQGTNPNEKKVGSVKLAGAGKTADEGTFVGTEGRSVSYFDTRRSDRTPNLYGQTGLLRINSARVGNGGYFDLSLHGRFFYTSTPLLIPADSLPAQAFLIGTGGPFISDCAKFGGKRNCDTYQQTFMAGTASFGVTIFDYLELGLTGTGSGNENSEANPRVLFSTGNVAVSAKGSLPIVVWTQQIPKLLKWKKTDPQSYIFPVPLAFGADIRVFAPSRANALGSQFDNLYIAPTGLFTFDLYHGRGWPFRWHLNAGYVFQSVWSAERTFFRVLNSPANPESYLPQRDPDRLLGSRCDKLLNVTDQARAQCRANASLSAVGLEYTYFDRISYGTGFEFPLPFVTPFLEFTGEIPVPVPWKGPDASIGGAGFTGFTPLGRGTGCASPVQDPINAAAVGTGRAGGTPMGCMFFNPFTWPSYLTPGLRITPGRGLAFDLALDVGLGGRFTIANGISTPLPWALQVGMSYAFSPFVAETEVELRKVEKKVEVKKVVASVKAGGKIGGKVFDAVSGQPIANAFIAFPEAEGPRILTGPDGSFLSYSMDTAIYTVIAEALDYDSAQTTADVQPGLTTNVELRLNPHPRPAQFKATVLDADSVIAMKDKALKSVVTLTDASGKVITLDLPEGVIIADVPPGKYNAVAKSDGYLLSGKQVTVEAGDKTVETFLLKVEPKKRLTLLTKERIEIKSTIHFEHNKARLLSSSFFILDEVVDTLLKNPQITKMSVEGHTDNTGDPEYNQNLSTQRAEAVREYLIQNGVAADRLDSVGYGDTRPLSPNTTEAGRARNRRVEFVIVNQGGEEEGSQQPAPSSGAQPAATEGQGAAPAPTNP